MYRNPVLPRYKKGVTLLNGLRLFYVEWLEQLSIHLH